MPQLKTKPMPKPCMRHMLYKQIKRNLTGAAILLVATYASMRMLIYEPHKRKYHEYYQNLDADALAQEISDLGYFQCVEGRSRDDDGSVTEMLKNSAKSECDVYRKANNI